MNKLKLTKGALAMVVAGAVTFSVTNALFVDQFSKLLAEGNAFTISRDLEKGNVIGQADKTVKDQTPKMNMKDSQTKLTHDMPAYQVASENKNKSDRAIVAIQQNTKQFSKSTTKSPGRNETTQKPVVKAKPAISTKKATTTTASTVTGTSNTSTTKTPDATQKPATSVKAPTTALKPPPGTNKTNVATTTTNRGQQVSQAAKEKHRDKTENRREI